MMYNILIISYNYVNVKSFHSKTNKKIQKNAKNEVRTEIMVHKRAET